MCKSFIEEFNTPGLPEQQCVCPNLQEAHHCAAGAASSAASLQRQVAGLRSRLGRAQGDSGRQVSADRRELCCDKGATSQQCAKALLRSSIPSLQNKAKPKL